jgi:hypothetical protein
VARAGEVRTMSIEIKDGRYFAGFWLLGDGKTRDWLYAVYRDKGSDKWTLEYRFRYYEDNIIDGNEHMQLLQLGHEDQRVTDKILRKEGRHPMPFAAPRREAAQH